MKGVFDAIVRWFARRRGSGSLRVVDQLPLFGGAIVHVVDVGRRRLVFATSQRAICLLAQFESTLPDKGREEAAMPVADSM